MDVKNLSSNWKQLQSTFKSTRNSPEQIQNGVNGIKRKRRNHQDSPTSRKVQKGPEHAKKAMQVFQETDPKQVKLVSSVDTSVKSRVNAGLSADVEVGKYVAIDCEMVGVGPPPALESALARVSVVNYNGEQVYDSFVQPKETVTDWRTKVSGISPRHMHDARTFEEVQADIAKLLKDRIVVGHALRNDFHALLLDHPKRDIRDTARHPPYRAIAGGSSPRLKILTSELLGLEIQGGEHSSIEDARACMLLFRKDKDSFEREHAKKWPTVNVVQRHGNGNGPSTTNKSGNRKKKKKR